MFDIGFFELLLLALVALVVVGPERLPDAVRTTARWWSGLKRSLTNARMEIEREVGADDIRRELHNERILRELEESRREVEQALGEDAGSPVAAARQSSPAEPAATPTPSPEAEHHAAHKHSVEAEDYLPEQDENAEDLQDPEYPEHFHEHGDPALNEFHPHHHWPEDEPHHDAAGADAPADTTAQPAGDESASGGEKPQ